MTYGVRWEFNRPPTDCCGGVLVPDHAINGSQGTVTFQKADSWFQRRNANAFGPALALAWNPRGGKTVYRAGYRMAFDTLSTFQITAVSGNVVGAVVNCVVPVTNPAGTTLGCIAPAGLNNTISGGFPLTIAPPTNKPSDFFLAPAAQLDTALTTAAFDPKLKVPTVHEWDLTIQRELPAGFTVEVGYIGKRGLRLYRAYDLNQLNVNQPGFIDSFEIARNNVGNGCKADGTGCPAGVTRQTPTLLLSLATSAFLNNSTVRTQLIRNGIGDLMRRLDSSTNSKWAMTCATMTVASPCFPANFARPNPQFGQIFYFDSGGDSYFHGAFAHLRRRLGQGLTMAVSYTFSKSIDDMSVDPVGATSGGGLSSTNSRTPTDINNFRLDRSRSDFDNRHVVVTNLLYELPFGHGRKFGSSWPGVLNEIAGGWTVTAIHTFQSGEPYTLNSNLRTFNGGLKVGRAEVISCPNPPTCTELSTLEDSLKNSVNTNIVGPVLIDAAGSGSSSLPTPDPRDPRFNTCRRVLDSTGAGTSTYICIPAAGNPGMGRNTLQGPHIWNADFGVLKDFQLTERWRFQFRAEFFNVFNHPNFENPRNATSGSPTLTSSAFGQTCCVTASLPSSATIIALGEPNRVIQFSGKIIF